MSAVQRLFTLDHARDALQYLPSNLPREEWAAIAAALNGEFGDGAYSLFDEWSATAANYHKSDAQSTWKSCSRRNCSAGTLIHIAKAYGWHPKRQQPLSSEACLQLASERTKREADRKARAEAQEQAYNEAATRAERILQQATRDASEHPYVVIKAIRPHGVKANERDLLVIPIYSALNGHLQTVQFIDRDGNKKMLTGGRCTNGCFPFSDVPNFWANASNRLGIAEGCATGATLAESLPSVAMFAAFSASNLAYVARALRARYPDAEITVFGDNDASGTGQRYAHAAANAVDGLVAIPPVPGHDWNDFAMRAA